MISNIEDSINGPANRAIIEELPKVLINLLSRVIKAEEGMARATYLSKYEDPQPFGLSLGNPAEEGMLVGGLYRRAAQDALKERQGRTNEDPPIDYEKVIRELDSRIVISGKRGLSALRRIEGETGELIDELLKIRRARLAFNPLDGEELERPDYEGLWYRYVAICDRVDLYDQELVPLWRRMGERSAAGMVANWEESEAGVEEAEGERDWRGDEEREWREED